MPDHRRRFELLCLCSYLPRARLLKIQAEKAKRLVRTSVLASDRILTAAASFGIAGGRCRQDPWRRLSGDFFHRGENGRIKIADDEIVR